MIIGNNFQRHRP